MEDNCEANNMNDFFKELEIKLSCKENNIKIIKSDKITSKSNHSLNLFKFGISDSIKFIYNNYREFNLCWEEKALHLSGFVNFISYEKIFEEHKELCEISEMNKGNLTNDQIEAIEDIYHWYPIFKFPNGDAFCYDNRNGKIVFFEHDFFDCGPNLYGIIIAKSMDYLFNNWSKVLFVDIYDWTEGVNEDGIDLNKEIFKQILKIKVN